MLSKRAANKTQCSQDPYPGDRHNNCACALSQQATPSKCSRDPLPGDKRNNCACALSQRAAPSKSLSPKVAQSPASPTGTPNEFFIQIRRS
ncbi:hypothetical protein NDU88_000585 [Pleurodeles waltl]|uniref:Uncharacterized protein n=1 Tax=Pleurodeles waltl TaxID=8319 RepID=A0AAV7V6M2_PLEWA|nr:hypothetical protein NDU88_000585 [Pleurodeles waltl]